VFRSLSHHAYVGGCIQIRSCQYKNGVRFIFEKGDSSICNNTIKGTVVNAH